MGKTNRAGILREVGTGSVTNVPEKHRAREHIFRHIVTDVNNTNVSLLLIFGV